MSTDMITPGMVIAGRYRIVKQLGEGGVGAVYLVQHVHTDERLALKVLHTEVAMDPTTIERFRAEARAPARIDSDHIVRVTDADVASELGGAPFLVMEFLRGRDLGGEVEARQTLHPKEVVLYLRQTARALDKAHGIGIVHRDLKPENIFLTVREDGTPSVKLLDFGIAKITGTAAAGGVGSSKTKTGAVFGTPLYMAPEQARAQAHLIGPHTDVWALGLIAARMMLGGDYWQAETLSDLIVQIVVDPIPAPSQRGSTFGPAFDAWFLRCCQRDHAQRFRSAGEAITELAAALGVVEGPQLVADVADILRRAHAAEANVQHTVAGAPMLAVAAQSAASLLTTPAVPLAMIATNSAAPFGATPATPLSFTPPGGVPHAHATTAMGSTMLASATSTVHPGQSTSSGNAAGGKLIAVIAAVIVVLGLLGIAAFFGLRSNGENERAAASPDPAPLPLPSAMQKPREVPAGTAVVSEPVVPVASETAAPATAAATRNTSSTSKSIPTGSKPTKKPNDDDLMSGRK